MRLQKKFAGLYSARHLAVISVTSSRLRRHGPRRRLTAERRSQNTASIHSYRSSGPCLPAQSRSRPISQCVTCRSEQQLETEKAKEGVPWKSKAPWFLSCMFAAGATLGPALDGIHGTVHLLQYDSAQFYLGSVESSGWVALLLGTFYAVIGSLHIVGDQWQTINAQQQLLYTKQSLPFVLASLGTVALLLYTSAVLYDNGISYPVIAAILLGLASINFKVFEDTKQGLALAALCACAAPVSELIIMNVFGLWHYPHPNVFQNFGRGLPSWVSACYFFYTPAVGNLARFAWKRV